MSEDAPILMLIDFQYAIDDPSWGRRCNSDAEKYAACLLYYWRQQNWPIIHIRHDSIDETSSYAPNKPTHAFKADVHPEGDEYVLGKNFNNAFIETELGDYLKKIASSKENKTEIVVAGVLMEHSVGQTAKHASCLGYDVIIASDATAACDTIDMNGAEWCGEDVLALELSLFKSDYGDVKTTAEILKL